MRKRILSLGLILTMVLTLCGGMALAVETRASSTLTYYPVGVSKGENEGEVDISYDVLANKKADEVGVSSIKIYKLDGTYVTTVTGTVTNGLLRTNATRHSSTYTYKGTSGVTYYAEVTVYAKIGSDSDSRTVTTPSVKAP